MARSERSVQKERFWRGMVTEQRRGGGSIRAFCREKGISEPSFYAWRKELQKRDAPRAVDKRATDRKSAVAAKNPADGGNGGLIPVEVVGGRGERASQGHRRSRPLEIGTPGGFTLRFGEHTTPEIIARLLDVITTQRMRTEAGEGDASC